MKTLLGSRMLCPILIHEGRLHPPSCCLARLYTTKSIYVEKSICAKKLFRNSLTVPKNVEQCRKYPIPYLNTLKRTIPYLNTLSRTIPYLNTLNRTIPYLNTLNPILIHYRRHIRVVGQSESSITSPESSRLGSRSLLGSRLESARYSLS